MQFHLFHNNVFMSSHIIMWSDNIFSVMVLGKVHILVFPRGLYCHSVHHWRSFMMIPWLALRKSTFVLLLCWIESNYCSCTSFPIKPHIFFLGSKFSQGTFNYRLALCHFQSTILKLNSSKRTKCNLRLSSPVKMTLKDMRVPVVSAYPFLPLSFFFWQ